MDYIFFSSNDCFLHTLMNHQRKRLNVKIILAYVMIDYFFIFSLTYINAYIYIRFFFNLQSNFVICSPNNIVHVVVHKYTKY